MHYHSVDFIWSLCQRLYFRPTGLLGHYFGRIGSMAYRWALVQGTLVMAAVEIVLLLTFVEIFAHKTAAQIAQSQDALANWLLRLAEYLIVGVIPYVAPFVSPFGFIEN